MATFPALTPSARSYTPGQYPHSTIQSYSGEQTRVLLSNVVVGTSLTLEFIGLSASDFTSILAHYTDQQGSFKSFALPSAVFSGASDPTLFTLSGYQWIYAESPQVEDLCGPLYNVSITLEQVPFEGAAAGGVNFRTTGQLVAGLATVSITTPAATLQGSGAFTGGAVTASSTATGLTIQATAQFVGGGAGEDGSAAGATLSATGSFNAGAGSAVNITSATSILYWSGNSTARSLTGAGFAPGFVAIRMRTGAQANSWWDHVRGTNVYVRAGEASSEQTTSTGLTSFDSDGFSIGTNSLVNYSANGDTFMGWCLIKGGTAANNTNGTITTSVSNQADTEYSIATYTGPTGAGNHTIGHGLSGTPDLVIIKRRGSTTAPWVGGPAIADNYYLSLGSNSATATNDTAVYRGFGATTVSVGNSLTQAGQDYVMWAFKASSLSAFNTFTGTGSATYTETLGWQPQVLLIKNITTTTSNWLFCYRPAGGTGFVTTISFNNNAGESVSGTVQFTSTGFSVATGGPGNVSGGTTKALYWAMK